MASLLVYLSQKPDFMKRIIFLFVLLVSGAFLPAEQSGAMAQIGTLSKKDVKVPTIGVKLMYGETLDFGTTQIKFKEVTSDSRCPKDVSCVQAGEANAIIEIYKEGKITSGKELTFSAPSRVLDIVSSESLKVKAMLLQPYPKTQAPKDKKDYYIILDVSGL